MDEERRRRKHLFALAVALLEWGLITGVAVAASYGEVETAAIPFGVAAIVVMLAALVAWSGPVGGRWKLNSSRLRIVRFFSYSAYPVMLGNILLVLLPLGWDALAAARPTAFLYFRIGAAGLVIMFLITAASLFRWQAGLKILEDLMVSGEAP
jgi:hypothetical protein